MSTKLVPAFSVSKYHDNTLLETLATKYPHIPDPCALQCTTAELDEHITFFTAVANEHYRLGTKWMRNGMPKGCSAFPKNRCGPSTLNVGLSLLAHNYPMVGFACSKKPDHAYLIVPVVTERCGVVIIDPTAPQMGVAALVQQAWEPWDYRNSDGMSMFPKRITGRAFLHDNDTTNDDRGKYVRVFSDDFDMNAREFLKQAYAAPVSRQ